MLELTRSANHEQVKAYSEADAADLAAVQVSLFAERFPAAQARARAIDICCGSGETTLRFARAYPAWTIDGIDGSERMLWYARSAARDHELLDRVRLHQVYVPPGVEAVQYDVILCTGSLHRFRRPADLWQSIRNCAKQGSRIFVTDCAHPASEVETRALAARSTAFTVEEIREQLVAAKLGNLEVERVGDGHLVVWGRAAVQPSSVPSA